MVNKFWVLNLLAAKLELIIILKVKQIYLLVQSMNAFPLVCPLVHAGSPGWGVVRRFSRYVVHCRGRHFMGGYR